MERVDQRRGRGRKERCGVEFEKLSIQEIKGVPEGEQVLKLTGPLTIKTLFGFREAVQATTAPLLILDLTDTPYVDSAGLGVLVNAHVSCVGRGRGLALVGVADRVQSLFTSTNVHKILVSFPTLQEAHEAATSGLFFRRAV